MKIPNKVLENISADMVVDGSTNKAYTGTEQTKLAGIPTPASGISTLESTYSITADDDTYADSGLSVTLPDAGTYLVFNNIRFTLRTSSGEGNLIAKFYNSTDAADVANSMRVFGNTSTTDVNYKGEVCMLSIVTVAASKVIKLYVKTSGAPTWALRDLTISANGYSQMGYVKIA